MSSSSLDSLVGTFCSRKAEFRSLSNFWEGEVVVGGRVYATGEHAFHGEKFWRLGAESADTVHEKALQGYAVGFQGAGLSAVQAKRRGGRKGMPLTSAELERWKDDLSFDVQREICRYKYDRYKEVRDDLEKSGTKVLVHSAMRCSLEQMRGRTWEGKATLFDGRVVMVGENRLGNLWMECRGTL